MCLGVPGKVVSIDGGTAMVDFFGVRRRTRLDVIDEPVEAGDYILNHVGFAIRRIPESEIGETLALYETLLRETGDDMMADDIRGEIEATGREAPESVWDVAAMERAVRDGTAGGSS